jgi:hypothetical protein
MQKMHLVTHEAHRQGKRVYRVDINFRNTFNAMSQAALWHVMNMFHIPDVALLEQIYDSATVRLAPNDAESATITFDTVAYIHERSREITSHIQKEDATSDI